MKQLLWYDKLQLAVMILMAAAMPISWQLGLWVALALAGVSLVKVVAQRRIGNPALGRGLRWSLIAVLVYWCLLAMTAFYSTDTANAWYILGHKAVLLIFPLCFLLSDTSYLTLRRLRWLGYALLAAAVGVFLFFAAKSLPAIIGGASITSCIGEGAFDPRHHSYYAFYAAVALSFAYFELAYFWPQLRGWLRGLLIASIPMLVAYIIAVDSRAGILSVVLIVVFVVLHQAIRFRRLLVAIVAALLLVGGGVGLTLLPGYNNPITDTISKLRADRGGDARVLITRSAWHVAKEDILVGHGVGDYKSLLVARYDTDGYQDILDPNLNAHNQFMETLLAAGIVGLLALLAMLFLPFLLAWHARGDCLSVVSLFTALITFNLLFESMLERQMGLLFIGYFLSVMVLIMSVEENKFGRVPKS